MTCRLGDAMLSFSFAYDVKEDRICLRLSGEEDMIWFTRRLTIFLLTQAANRFAESASAGMEKWVTPKAPVELEHELAVTEPDEGQVGSPVQIASGKFEEEAKANAVLCERITLTSHSHGVRMQLVAGDERRSLNLSRAGFHRFLRALLLVANRVRWGLPEVPHWLSKNYLPGPIQGMVENAIHSSENVGQGQIGEDPTPSDDRTADPGGDETPPKT